MPLRLDPMMSDRSSPVLSDFLDQALHHAEDAFATEDGRYVLLSKDILDEKTNTPVGHCIVTMARDTARKTLNILDMDIVLDSDAPVELQFVTRYEGSSDANEYYEVISQDAEQHLCVETVNRHTVPGDILDTKQTVYVSAFPFKVSIYNSTGEMNHALGFDQRSVKFGGEEFTVGGLSENFAALGGVLSGVPDAEGSPWSTMVGTVCAWQDASLRLGDWVCEVCIVQLRTALGVLPTIMGKELFETDKLAVGKAVLMDACIKANFLQGKYPKKNA